MSGFRGHLTGGFIFISIFLFINEYLSYFSIKYDFYNIFLIIIITSFMSLISDVDIKSSKIFGVILALSVFMSIYFIFINYLFMAIFILAILLLVSFIPKHRGFFHSILFGLIISLPLCFIDIWLATIAFIAYFSHLLLDGKIKLI